MVQDGFNPVHLDSKQLILIVDDSDDDFEATTRALFRNHNLANPIHRCENGEDTLDFLYHRGAYAPPNAPARPGIILLDLNMPGVDGRQVLKEIKNDEELKSIPVIVMTNSDDEKDIADCYRMGANTYIVKPIDWERFLEAISRLKEYWFGIAILPKK